MLGSPGRKERKMKDKLILKDGSIIELETGASLAALTVICADKAAMVATWDKLMPDNLAAVSVQNGDGLTVGNYTDLVQTEPHMAATVLANGTIVAVFGLREKTSEEKRLDALEEGQQVQDGAISDLGAVTSTLAEQVEGGQA